MTTESQDVRVIATARVRPEARTDLLAQARAFIDATRREDGCIAYDLLASVSDPCALATIERWSHRGAGASGRAAYPDLPRRACRGLGRFGARHRAAARNRRKPDLTDHITMPSSHIAATPTAMATARLRVAAWATTTIAAATNPFSPCIASAGAT